MMGRELHVILPEEVGKDVEAAVASGEFATEADVIRDAVEEWRIQRFVQSVGLDELRRLWREGVDSGSSAYEGIDQIIAEARSKFSPV